MLSNRPLAEGDCPAVCRFAQTAEELFYIAPRASFPWQPEELARVLTERLSNSVFLLDGNIVGFANFYNAEIGVAGSIGNVVVHPRYRQQGLGRQIIRQMLEKGFDDHRFNTIYIACFSPNTPALQLYKTLGFTAYDLEQRVDYQGEPISLIHLMLGVGQYRAGASGC